MSILLEVKPQGWRFCMNPFVSGVLRIEELRKSQPELNIYFTHLGNLSSKKFSPAVKGNYNR